MTKQEESQSKDLTKTDSKSYLAKAIELRSKGLTLEDIGKHFDVTKQAIHSLFKRHIPYIETVDEIRNSRADILTAKGIELLLSLTPDEIKKMPPGSRAMAFGLFFDKERLEMEKSTENISIYEVENKYSSKLLEKQAMERKAGVEVSDNLIEEN